MLRFSDVSDECKRKWLGAAIAAIEQPAGLVDCTNGSSIPPPEGALDSLTAWEQRGPSSHMPHFEPPPPSPPPPSPPPSPLAASAYEPSSSDLEPDKVAPPLPPRTEYSLPAAPAPSSAPLEKQAPLHPPGSQLDSSLQARLWTDPAVAYPSATASPDGNVQEKQEVRVELYRPGKRTEYLSLPSLQIEAEQLERLASAAIGTPVAYLSVEGKTLSGLVTLGEHKLHVTEARVLGGARTRRVEWSDGETYFYEGGLLVRKKLKGGTVGDYTYADKEDKQTYTIEWSDGETYFYEGGEHVRTTFEEGRILHRQIWHYERGVHVRTTFEQGHPRHGETDNLKDGVVVSIKRADGTVEEVKEGETAAVAASSGADSPAVPVGDGETGGEGGGEEQEATDESEEDDEGDEDDEGEEGEEGVDWGYDDSGAEDDDEDAYAAPPGEAAKWHARLAAGFKGDAVSAAKEQARDAPFESYANPVHCGARCGKLCERGTRCDCGALANGRRLHFRSASGYLAFYAVMP